MFDAYKTKYRLLVVDQYGIQRNIKEFATNLGWEQNARQLATTSTFNVENEKTEAGRISKLVKPGCLVIITAECESHKEEVARGYVTTWEPNLTNKKCEFKVTAYDELFNLMKSQDNLYYSEGTGTQTIISDVVGNWGIPLARYEGPNVSHDKLAFSTKNLAEVIYEVLDDAAKKGGSHAFLRCTKGKLSVLRWGPNKEIWCFDTKNSIQASYKISTESMITRVKVIGEENDDGRSPVEATLNGRTQFGIRQKIYRRGTDESLEDAQAAAQEILDEEGEPQETMTVKAPDVPFIRKGDRVYCFCGYARGYYFVRGIKHDAGNGQMTMDLTTKESEK